MARGSLRQRGECLAFSAAPQHMPGLEFGESLSRERPGIRWRCGADRAMVRAAADGTEPVPPKDYDPLSPEGPPPCGPRIGVERHGDAAADGTACPA